MLSHLPCAGAEQEAFGARGAQGPSSLWWDSACCPASPACHCAVDILHIFADSFASSACLYGDCWKLAESPQMADCPFPLVYHLFLNVLSC